MLKIDENRVNWDFCHTWIFKGSFQIKAAMVKRGI